MSSRSVALLRNVSVRASIVILEDEDIISLVRFKAEENQNAIYQLLRDKYEEIVM